MADPTDSFVVFTEKLQAIVESVQADLGIADVWYGDQQQIPRTPTVCVVADGKDRAHAGAPRRVANTLKAFILVYHSKVQDIQLNSKEADKLAEALEAAVHEDPTLGGIVIHSLVTRTESGEMTRRVNTLATQFRSTRLTVEGLSKTMLPMSPGYNQP